MAHEDKRKRRNQLNIVVIVMIVALTLATTAWYQPSLSALTLEMRDDQYGPTTVLGRATAATDSLSASASSPSFAATRFGPEFRVQVSQERLQHIKLQAGSWMGNTWVPPPGWHAYSASQLRTLYKDRSIMWIGDSTMRRAANTMHAVINYDSTDNWVDKSDETAIGSDNPPLKALDHTSIIDVNKKRRNEHCVRVPREFWHGFDVQACRPTYRLNDHPEALHNPAYVSKSLLRHLEKYMTSNSVNNAATVGEQDKATTVTETNKGDVNITAPVLLDINQTSNTSNHSNTASTSNTDHRRLAEMDSVQEHNVTHDDFAEHYYILAKHECLANIETVIRAELAVEPHLRLASLVDTVIISAGIWEAFHGSANGCTRAYQQLYPDRPFSLQDRLATLFDALIGLQSPTLEVVFRTTGYASTPETLVSVDSMHNYTRQYAANLYQNTSTVHGQGERLKCERGGLVSTDPNATSHVVNEDQCVSNLTFVDWGAAVRPRSFSERIRGDIAAHYGLEPRLVLIQMLTNHWLERREAGL
jgi:hypothetical protein